MYELDLSRTHHRALLRMLYKTCERFELPFEQAFLDLEFIPAGGGPAATTAAPSGNKKDKAKPKKEAGYKHPKSKDADGVWCVPSSGVLRTRFTIDEALVETFGDDAVDRPA